LSPATYKPSTRNKLAVNASPPIHSRICKRAVDLPLEARHDGAVARTAHEHTLLLECMH
jgi:hypothetical protein